MKQRSIFAALSFFLFLGGCSSEDLDEGATDLLTEARIDPLATTPKDEGVSPVAATNAELFALANEAGDGPQDVVFYSRRKETLDLFAQWSGLTRTILAESNHLKDNNRDLPLNTPITIPLTADQLDRFEHARTTFHKRYQTAFYEKFSVIEMERYTVVKGDSLWKIARRSEVPVPLWLLEKVNPGKNLGVLHVGNTVQLPLLTRVGESLPEKNEPELASTKPTPVARPSEGVQDIPDTAATDLRSTLLSEGLIIKVQVGESLGHYSSWSGLPISTILHANVLDNPDHIRLGQPLNIPLEDKEVALFYAKRRTFLQQRGVPKAEDKAKGQWTTHTVAPGENAWIIAIKRYGISLSELEALNPDINLERLMPGVLLRIPVKNL
jgi:LysM repeat protein